MNTSTRRSAPPHSVVAQRPVCWVLLLAAFASSPALAQSATIETPTDATALTIVTPGFPPAATAPPGGIRVDVTGTVRANGTFEPQAITAEGDQAPYIAAVAEVVKGWPFLPAVDDAQCAPIDSTERLSIWFEGSAAEPRIFVSQPAPKPKVEPPPFESIYAPRWTFSGMREGQVRVLMRVSPEGQVKSTQIRSSSPPGYFDADVLRNAGRTIVTWKAPGPGRDICAQREYRMCLGPGAGVMRNAACASTR